VRITVTNSISLDGVMQAPGTPDEDRRDDFPFGGWAVPYNDPVMMAKMGEGMARPGVLLLGRWTYESLGRAWRGRTDNPFTAVLDNTTKYVASRTLTEPLDWPNSVLLSGDAADAVARLKPVPRRSTGQSIPCGQCGHHHRGHHRDLRSYPRTARVKRSARARITSMSSTGSWMVRSKPNSPM
jgi:dihydrofolate reductase